VVVEMGDDSLGLKVTSAALAAQMHEEYRKEFRHGVKEIIGFVAGAGIVAIVVAITLYLSDFIDSGQDGGLKALQPITLFLVYAGIAAVLSIVIMSLAWLFATMAPRWVSKHAQLWLGVLSQLRRSLATAQGNLDGIKEIEKKLASLVGKAEYSAAAEKQLVYWAQSPGDTLTRHFANLETEPDLDIVRITGTFLGVGEATYNLSGHIDDLLEKRSANRLRPFKQFRILAPSLTEAYVRGARKFATDVLGSVLAHYHDKEFLREKTEVGIRFIKAKDIFPCFQIWGDYGFLLVPSVGEDDIDYIADKWPIGLVGAYGPETAATRKRLRDYFDTDLYGEADPSEIEHWVWNRNTGQVDVVGYRAGLCGRCDRQSLDRLSPDLTGSMSLDAGSHSSAQAAAATLKELYSNHAAA
jgi:hypothetical protein